jgi:hypothetical protein
MKRWHLLVVASLVLSISVSSPSIWAQAKPATETLGGRIVAAADGLPLPDARIWIFDAKGSEQYTAQQNSTGEFRIVLPTGYYFVLIGALGCVPYAKEIWLRPGKPMNLKVRLELDLENLQSSRVK